MRGARWYRGLGVIKPNVILRELQCFRFTAKGKHPPGRVEGGVNTPCFSSLSCFHVTWRLAEGGWAGTVPQP